MTKERALAIVAGAFFVCAGFEIPAQSVTNVNGVRTVVYGANTKPKGKWAINPTPLVRITSDNGVDLLDIGAVARFNDGSLITMSRQSSTLHLFSASGKHVRNIGRRGRGPGEFDADVGLSLFRIRDTIVVSDGNGIAQVFAPDGKYLRSEARTKGGPRGEQMMRSGFFADGRSVLAMYPGRDTVPPARKMLYYTLFVEHRDVRRELLRFPYQMRLSLPRGIGSYEIFGGYGSAVILRAGVCTGYPKVYALDCYATDGKQISHVERPDVRGIPVTAADKQEHFDDMARANPGAGQSAFMAEVRAATKFAEHMPAFGRLIASLTDDIWVEPSLPISKARVSDPSPETATVWSVFAPNGDWLSDVTLPKRFRLMEAGANYVAGVIRDSDDLEEIVVYSLLKR